jgi:nickel-dependent lactate racemase
VKVEINRLIAEYDHVVILGPVFPHEVVGISGGYKYLFPGICGSEFLNFFHWVGAVITLPRIIGNKNTPVRDLINLAADFVKVPVHALCMVVHHQELRGLFAGDPKEAWSEAADLAARLEIVYVDKPYQRILSCAPPMYDDLWTGGKCMYKMENVVADGGELVIYAPHIDEVSYTHGRVLDKIGYHVRDFFLRQWDRYKRFPWGVLAHSTHVRGIGTYENGDEKPRVRVTLATAIPEERCKRINLGYLDPKSIRQKEWEGREAEGILMVPRAGEMLYRLKNPPEWARAE